MQTNHAMGTWMRGFVWPLRRPGGPPGNEAADTAPAALERRAASTLKVLLVDDSQVNRLLASAQLLRWGIEPVLACDGAQAVEQVAQQAFDLVLMDVSMPVMDGLEATDRIRRFELAHPERVRVPVVAYTAGPAANNPTLLQRHGIDAVLRKPCDSRMVGRCLEQVCGVSLA